MKIVFSILFAGLVLASCNAGKIATKPAANPQPAANAKPLEGTYWMLTELNGQPVNPPEQGAKSSYIYFNAAKKRVGLSGGCNVMGGSYELMDGNRIKFGSMISTMMACPDMTNEDGLKKMAELVDNYAIQEDNLLFAKAKMAPLARFKAVPPPEGFKFD